MLYLYLLIEVINIIYTSRFGLKRPLDQPLAYLKLRKFLKLLKYGIAIVWAITILLAGNILMAMVIVAMPFFVEKALFSYCKKRALKRLVVFYTSKEKMKKDVMKPKEAIEVASTVLEPEIKEGTLAF